MNPHIIHHHSAIDGQHLHGLHYALDKPKALVVIFHGMAEHQKRYESLASALNQAGFDVLTMDQRGHGDSLFDGTLKGHFADEEGWERNLIDAHAMIQAVHTDPSLPLIVFGHSMGTLVARSYLKRHPETVTGLYLSGSPDESPMAKIGILLAKTIALTLGKRHPSPLLTKLSFGSFNQSIPHPKTAMDWLSVDEGNVRRYIADPLCGFDFTAQGFVDLLEGMHEVYQATPWKVVHPELPIHFISGQEDPCHRPGGLKKAVQCLSAQGYTQVSMAYDDGVRHEVFNDIHRAQATQDLIAWLNTVSQRV